MDVGRIDGEIGEALRIARLAKGVTQDDLSAAVEAMGVKLSQATIGKIERGERKVTLGESYALSRALGLFQDELVGGISATSAFALAERLDRLRDELKEALHAFESGQALVIAQARALDPSDQVRLRDAVRESLEDVIEEYRRDRQVANESWARRKALDGDALSTSPIVEAFGPIAGEQRPRAGLAHPHAVAVILQEAEDPSDG